MTPPWFASSISSRVVSGTIPAAKSEAGRARHSEQIKRVDVWIVDIVGFIRWSGKKLPM
jgi:hypothetical protein